MNLIPDDSSPNLNLIIHNIEVGNRNTLNEVIVDLRLMIETSKKYVESDNSAGIWLETICCFESGLLKILLDDNLSITRNMNGSEE